MFVTIKLCLNCWNCCFGAKKVGIVDRLSGVVGRKKCVNCRNASRRSWLTRRTKDQGLKDKKCGESLIVDRLSLIVGRKKCGNWQEEERKKMENKERGMRKMNVQHQPSPCETTARQVAGALWVDNW